MAADANIFAQYLRPVRSVQDYSNDMDAAEQNKLTLAASRMKAQQDQLAVADDNALRSAYQQSGGDKNALLKILQGGGQYKAAAALEKSMLDADKERAGIAGTKATTWKTEAETIDKSLNTAKTFVNQIQDANGAAAYLNGLYADPVLGPLAQRLMPKDKAIEQIPQDPEGLLKWKAGHMNITGDKLIELLKPKLDSTMLGANQSFGATDQFTGKRTETGSAPILESANNVANNERMVSEGDKTRAQALKVAGMVDARSRDATAATMSRPFEVTGPDGNPVLVQQDKQGNITPVSGYGPKGGTSGKPLPPAVVKNITEARDNAATIDRLSSSFKDDFASKGVLGMGSDMSLSAKGVMGTDGDAVDWWKNYRKQAELVERHALFGAALTPAEQASWRSSDIGPGMDAKVIKRNLTTRAKLTKQISEMAAQDQIDAGHSKERISAIAGRVPVDRPGGGVMSPEDTQAMEWANKNPNDPRSKQIKQRLGGG